MAVVVGVGVGGAVGGGGGGWRLSSEALFLSFAFSLDVSR